MQNGGIDPKAENIVEVIITKLNSWCGKPKAYESYESWTEIITMKKKQNEDIEKFLLKLETAVAKLHESSKPLPYILLALHLLHSVNVDEIQRRLIVANLYLEKETILEDINSTIRLQKVLLWKEREKVKENPTLYTQSNNYRNEGRYKNYDHRPRSRNRYIIEMKDMQKDQNPEEEVIQVADNMKDVMAVVKGKGAVVEPVKIEAIKKEMIKGLQEKVIIIRLK